MGIVIDDAPEPRGGFTVSDPWRSFVATVRAAILDPTRFFRDLYRQRPSDNPVPFAVVCGVIGLLLTYAVAPVESWVWGDPLPGADRAYWVILALSPLLAWVGLYIFAAFQHLLVMIFVRRRKGFEATLRVEAYATAVALLGWIPIVGHPASAYGLYITMLGIKELHETTTTRALLATLVPLLIFLANIAWSFWP